MSRQFEILETKARVLADNNAQAALTRREMERRGTLFINLMGSPGAGKTSVLLGTIGALKDRYRIGVMEADADGDVDAAAVAAAGIPVIQLHTGGSCHMDADMTRRGLERLDTEGLDLIFLENVGNLVCPAEFDVGADLRVTILSTPEGHDKPLKYPLMFQVCDVLLINKMDVAAVFDFDEAEMRKNVALRNDRVTVFPLSAKTGDGFSPWVEWLAKQIDDRRTQP